jgi:hypothetical protein
VNGRCIGDLPDRDSAQSRPEVWTAAHDSPIAFTAAEHQATLLSLDQRAIATYAAVGAAVEQLVP